MCNNGCGCNSCGGNCGCSQRCCHNNCGCNNGGCFWPMAGAITGIVLFGAVLISEERSQDYRSWFDQTPSVVSLTQPTEAKLSQEWFFLKSA
jgi:hypothetical protein